MSMRDEVRAHALGLPGAWEDRPWEDDLVAKVGKKIFVFFGSESSEAPGVQLGVKLPASHEEALALPFVQPMGYGLDRGHWVSIAAPEDAPLDMLLGWIEESYRAVAPKRLVAELDSRPA
jgi:predicted DNA-binding protein (MmcQ/YjbR family)